jgi:tetratricopeptide (TPR) repeat protein
MEVEGTNILSVDHFRIDFFSSNSSTKTLVITFTQFSNRMLSGLGFAGKFAIGSGFDLIAIKSDLDDWYQGLPCNTFEIIEQFLTSLPTRYAVRATYGSSMGGYAAILFAQPLRADIALALSPQFDITGDWDTRWAAYAKGPISILSQDNIRVGCRYFIAYDPADLDRLHFERFSEIIPDEMLTPIKVPYAGHPVGSFLRENESLKTIAYSILGNLATSITVDKKLRNKRNSYPHYYFNISWHCFKKRKLRWARSLISQAVKLDPFDPEYQLRAAIIEDACGNLVEAISHAAFAVAMAPKSPHLIATLSHLLLHVGKKDLALHYIECALSLDPNLEDLKAKREAIKTAMAVT